MGRDKSELVVRDGVTLRDRGMHLLEAHTDRTFLSIAADDSRTYEHPVLQDLAADRGPLAGLQAAIHHDPRAAWLVLACDLPLLTDTVLAHLVAHRAPNREATCFTSRHDGLPEPMCTIYEPAGAARLSDFLEGGGRCARKFLLSLDRTELELPEAAALDNCNRPEDLEEARLRLSEGARPKTVSVEFCGPLREEVGMPGATVQTEAATAAGLWEELRMKHRLSLDLDVLRLAINDEFQPWSTPLRSGDRLAFFPPFAGG